MCASAFHFSLTFLSEKSNHQQVESTHSNPEAESSDDPEGEIYKNLTEEQLHRAREYFECFICNERMSNFSNFRIHVFRHTSAKGAKKYKCEVCSKDFAKLRYLKAHLTTHNENRIFTCEICSQNFATKPSIRGHMRIHTGKWHGAIYSVSHPFQIYFERTH